MEFKFNIDEEVKVIATGKKGIVKSRKFEELKNINKEVITKITYEVLVEPMTYTATFMEDKLQRPFEFTKEFEHGLLGLMVDVNLKEGKVDMARYYHNKKFEV
jgi:hypothetical protein